MAEFRLERFKYTWKGDWETDTAYKRDDVVRVNGKSYVCVITHVSSAAFRTDLNAILPGSVPPQPQPKWVVMTNGFSFEGDWTSGTDYNLGDIVLYNGSLWLCTTDHLASVFSSNINNWTVFSQNIGFEGDWASATDYAPGAVVVYNGNVHKCVNAHTSSSTLETNADDWELYHVGVVFRGEWEGSTEYRVNDLVKYGGTIFRCTETHTADVTALDDAKFEIEINGSQYDGEWFDSAYYNQGDVVRHNGFMYYAIQNNFNSKPFQENGSSDWILISRGYSFVGEWSVTGAYKTGDVVLRGGNLYLALIDIGNGEVDGSSADYLDPDVWELLVPGKAFKGNWTIGTLYSEGDIIVWKGTAYTCNFEHEASIINFPGDNGSGYFYWDILIEAGQQAGLQEKGDLLTYGLNRQIDNDGSTVFDDSSIGDTRVGIGNTEQLLSVNADLEVYWRDVIDDAESIYVATNGIDDFGRGTFQKPFRTIKYAAEYVEDNFEPLTPVIIRVSTGKFEEVSPIIVPAGCAIDGDELRSTTVLANSPKPEYANYYETFTDYTNYFLSILLDVLEGTEITPQPGNEVEQFFLTEVPILDEQSGQPLLDIDGNPITQQNDFRASDIDGLDAIDDLIQDFKKYVVFQIADGSENPTVVGTNTLTTNTSFINAADILDQNKEFLLEEVYRYVVNELSVTNTERQIKGDLWSLMRGIIRDLRYSGNYGTLTAASSYANAVNGSQTDNLFFLRDSTGLRNMTTGGLQGVLNPPGVFDLYQKPTGGALVSLDPGWGPEDDRTWIKTRSPYIQNVTNTGFGCVGMKVDGALHEGGNKSMVANDFTQVLSDGIGMWVTNNARAELVSVFTYYCQIGYFAEDGGIIRAANGNNSYGRYGSIADGVDDTEVPQLAAAFNRNNEAQVSEAFAGGGTDEILIFEYSNAGQNYTTADATIIGAGANADIEYSDFRDNALFEIRGISPDGSSNAGGGGYLRRQGSAQETLDASSTIKLAATDITQFLSEIDGMRITITGGTGVGQYGYVSGFNFSTKEVTVRRDSDSELGWDHVVPGTPLVTAFDLTTRYRIEPRVVISEPGFSASSSNLFTNRTYADLAFGNITETYTGVSGSGNVIWRDDNQTRITINSIISDVAIQFNAVLSADPNVPFEIKGRTSEATATVTNISANTEELIEVDLDSNGTSFIAGEEIDLILDAGTGNTFDSVAIPAEFTVIRRGTTYNVNSTNAGSGYSINDKITILGTALGGSTPENDLTITVTEVTDDSTSSIVNFTIAGVGRGGRYVSLTTGENARYSDDGLSWTEVTLPFAGSYNTLIPGNNRFLAIANGESRLSSSLTGITWSEIALPLEAAWSDGVYGNGKFVLVATDTDIVVSSTDGESWTTGSIPDDTDGAGDSTESQWGHVAYGVGKYVAVSVNDLATATSTDGVTWTRHDSAMFDFTTEIIVSLAYGNDRFIVITDAGSTAYSFDGITWYEGGTLGITDFIVSDMKYDQGIFFAIGTDNGADTANCSVSEFGLMWNTRTLPSAQRWSALTYGNEKWVFKASAASTNAVASVVTGAQAKARAEVSTGSIEEIRIFDPGSGYSSVPTITIVDPNVTFEAAFQPRLGNGVLGQPDFINRGAGYRSSTSTITITGDGYADIIPVADSLTISGVINVPGPGVQITIEGIEDPDALVPGTLAIFSGVTVDDLGDDGTGNETNLVRFQISPRLDVQYEVLTGAEITLRERFSQCRISGHDFLDIGTGNFENTNYPDIYSSGNYFVAAPENEVYEANSGRVFYVSTDQDGNFRTGELFSVQQATGIVTISAQFFDLDGLSELALGGVRLGGSGTVVNEFSTDPTFAADSNNVIPTQRAIATFLADRLSVGGESLEVGRLQAGRVILGGFPENEINNAAGGYVIIPADVVFDGTFTSDDGEGNVTTEQTNVSGTIVSQMLFFKGFDETML